MRRVLERCELRPFRQEDAASLARMADDVTVWRNLRDAFPHPYSLEHARAYVARSLELPTGSNMAVTIGGEAVGAIGLKLGTDVERVSAELGYWLGAPFRGRGVMGEAIRAFTEDAFERFSLSRIFALPFADNAASCRALERAGFTVEGTLRRSAIKAGQIIDQRLYARLSEPRR